MKIRLVPLLLGLLISAHADEPVRPTIGSIKQTDPSLTHFLDPNAKIEVIASGFRWTEGPVWDKQNNRLLFSDVPTNKIHQWSENRGTRVFMRPSGYTGIDSYGRESGSNGLAFDKRGRLLICEHGDRRVSILTPKGGKMTLADNFNGSRLNSPNDLTIHPNGTIYFTDPPYGLPMQGKDPRRELDIFGVYRIRPDGSVRPFVKTLSRPNGVALSPEGDTVFVAQSDRKFPVILAYPIKRNGNAGREKLIFDAKPLTKKYQGLPDGLKVDIYGNLWASGPGGILIISPEGTLLGHILTGQKTSNCAWGDDGSTLYITASSYVLRVKTFSKGVGWK